MVKGAATYWSITTDVLRKPTPKFKPKKGRSAIATDGPHGQYGGVGGTRGLKREVNSSFLSCSRSACSKLSVHPV